MLRSLSKLMMYCLLLVSLVFMTGFTPLWQTTPEAPGLTVRITQVDTAQFPKVTVYVSVTDAKGEPVVVSPSQLELRENGALMTPDEVGGKGDIGPLTTLLVMDISGSMNSGGKLKAAQDAASAYVEQSRPGDEIGLLTFNTKTEYVQPLTGDRQVLLQAIADLKASGDTAMYDTVARGIDILASTQGRKAIILLTDGLDNRSKRSPLEVVQMVSPQGLSVSIIGLGDPTHSKGSITALNEPALSALATQAGGVYGYANNADSLRNLYERYGRAMQSEYALSYTSPSKLRDGVNRGLSVSLNGPAGVGLSSEVPISYNPGGLVPEVSGPASWGLFLALIGGLLLLLALPLLIGMLLPLFRGSKEQKPQPPVQGKVKLRSTSQPRVKLKG
jgi:Ca-activated chloride channel homolog